MAEFQSSLGHPTLELPAFPRRSASPDSELLGLGQAFSTHSARTAHPRHKLAALGCGLASLREEVGVPVKVVSEILGHASVTITYDTYSHVIPGMAEDATSKVAALVFGRST